MGEKIVELFAKAKEIGGFKGQMRLAVITKIQMTQAKETPDTSENIETIKRALEEIQRG